jgi:hypothetical protein
MKYRLVIEMDALEAERQLENDFTTDEIDKDRESCLSSILRDYGSGVGEIVVVS